MKTLAKVAAILLGVALILTLVSTLLVSLLFDPNQYRTEISKLVQEKTGRGFRIRGEIDFNFFPWLGLKANDLELDNADGFGDGPFATIDRVKLRVRLLPLLKKQLDIGKVSVSGLKLNLVQHQDGRNNWQGLLPGRAIATTGQSVILDGQAAAGAAFVATSVGGLDLKNSRISWIDERAGSDILIHGLRIRCGIMQPGKPFDVSWELSFRNRVSGLAGQCRLTSATTADLEQGTLAFQHTAIQLKLDQPTVVPEPIEIQAKADILLEPAKNRLQLSGLDLVAHELALRGDLTVDHLGQAPHATGKLASNTFNAKRLLRRLGRAIPTRSDPTAFEQASVACSVDALAGHLLLDSCEGTLDASKFSGRLEYNQDPEPTARFDLSLDRIDLDGYAAGSNAEPTEEQATQQSVPNAADHPAPASQTPVAHWWHWFLSKLRIDSALAAKSPRLVFTQRETAPDADTPAPATTPADISRPAGVTTVTGNVRIGALTFRKLRADNLATQLVLDAGDLRLEALQAGLYGGTLEGALDWRREREPGWQTRFHLVGVDLGRLLKDLNPDASFAAVAEDIRGTLAARGATREQCKQTLTGKMDLDLTKVKGTGFDLHQAIINATPALEGKLPSRSKRVQSVGLDRLTAKLVASQGRIQVKELTGKSRDLKLTGSGTIDLPRDQLAMLLLATLLASHDQSPAFSALAGVPIPIRITGPLAQPVVSLDLRDVLHNARETKQQERKEKRQERRELRRQKKRGLRN